VTPSTTNTAAQSCLYPQCNCPFDAPADPNWCARGLPRNTLTQQQGGEQEAGDCGDEALQRAYWLGWRNSAAWADRKDLWADRDSPAYTQERDDALGTLAAAVKLGKE